jgi:hypothetical protein
MSLLPKVAGQVPRTSGAAAGVAVYNEARYSLIAPQGAALPASFQTPTIASLVAAP